MEEYTLVLMEKNKKTGVLEKELAMYTVADTEDCIVNAFAEREDEGYTIFMKLQAPFDMDDDAFEAFYDSYEAEKFDDLCHGVTEVEDCFYPTWEFRFPMTDDAARTIEAIVRRHTTELAEVRALLSSEDRA